MKPFTLCPEDIAHILISLAHARVRGAFIPGGTATIATMSAAHKQRVTEAACVFFDLEADCAEVLAAFLSWEQWAQYIFEKHS